VELDAVLRRQAGVISRDQALAAGLSRQRISRLLTTGRWIRVHPRVYLMASRDLTDEARVRAAALWAGEPATVSGLAAAWWHGLWPDPPSTVDITVSPGRCLRVRPGVRVRRRELTHADRVGIRDLWITGLPLTVLEAAVALGERGPDLLDRAMQRRVSLEALRRAHARNLGRRGSAIASRLLIAAADRAASAAERELKALLRAERIAGWVCHYRLGGYEIDFAFPEHRVAVEVDGWAFHQDAQVFRTDRQRQNRLVLAGWTPLRFTWHDLTRRPGQVAAEIRAALARRAAA